MGAVTSAEGFGAVCGTRENDLNFFVSLAGAMDKKFEPLGGEEGHVTAQNEIPLGGASGGGGMLQRGDDAAERAFAGPAVFDGFEFTVEVAVFLSTGDNGNFRSAGLCQLNDFQQQWSRTKAK